MLRAMNVKCRYDGLVRAAFGAAIQGQGVAASCCAHLLANAGFRVSRHEGAVSRVPAVLIGEPTQVLLRDVFGQPALFDGLYQIDRRIEAWGRCADPVEVPHRAVVIAEPELLARLHDPGGPSGPAE